MPWKRDETEQRTGQKKYPWIEFEDGSIYREESKDMAQRIQEGKLKRSPAQPAAFCRRLRVIVPDEIEEYAAAHTTPPTELLAELAAETHARRSESPQMLTGTIEGRLPRAARPRAPGEARARARHVQRLLVALDGRGAAGRRAHRHVRGRRAARRGRAPLHRAEPVRRPDHRPPRPGARDDRAARGRVRLRLHRRRQGELPQLLRGAPAAAGARAA